MALKDTGNTRRDERQDVDIACEVMTDRSELAALLRCTELSMSGARIRSGIAPAQGELVVLSFKPPCERKELTLFAKVCHVVRRGRAVRGFGVQFLRTNHRERCALRDALGQTVQVAC
ncbi:MAG: PilZ domain-containing protein [Deltaproteobacteria bacterium]|nr:PilZ domain-containing protein [Deltaproteobacteria bacterium]